MASLFQLSTLALAAAACCNAVAQTSTAESPQALKPISVTGARAPVLQAADASVGGLTVPIKDAPHSIVVFTSDLLREAATKNLSQAAKLDASVGDSYNTTGFIETLQVRGFVLNSTNNYQRGGLPASSYSPLAFENLERIEILKGASGLQSGTSTPGGLVNFVLKKPTVEPLRALELGVGGRGGVSAALDVGGRVGGAASDTFGYRINAATEKLRPVVKGANGSRHFLSGAFDWRLDANTLVELEFEAHRKAQPSVPGYGLLDRDGDGVAETLPPVIDPRSNLNNQPWSLPFTSNSTAASLAVSHKLSAAWTAKFQAQTQRIKTNDRIIFPDGCSSAANYVYPGLCGNYDVDVYDYRSENERRKLTSAQARLEGRFTTGALAHALTIGVQTVRASEDFERFQAYNFIGTTNALAPIALSPDGNKLDLNTLRRDTSRELFVSDSITIGQLGLHVGLRHTQTTRSSVRTDGSRGTRYTQSFTSPLLGASYQLQPTLSAYASWGKGVETEVVPNRSDRFANPGEALPALQSRQTELGLKWQANPRLLATAALFSINKPYADDLPSSTAGAPPRRVAGGKQARHSGLELAATGAVNRELSITASATWLNARFTQAITPGLAGKDVTNVPRFTATAFADYKLGNGFAVNGKLRYSGAKPVTADNTVTLPATWLLDLGARYQQRTDFGTVVWRVAVENALNRKVWQDAPTQFWGGTYLFAAPARSLSLSARMDF